MNVLELHPENLTNFRDMEEELHKQISSKGGIASGKKRAKLALVKRQCEEMFENEALAQKYLDDEIYAFRQWKRSKAYRKFKLKRKESVG